MKLQWSIYNIVESVVGGRIIRNTRTGATVYIPDADYQFLDDAIQKKSLENGSDLESLSGDNGVLVDVDEDEVKLFSDMFSRTRDDGTNNFTIHFLPTMGCQLSCHYCYEGGLRKYGLMTDEVLEKSVKWLDHYFALHNIHRLKIVLIGGEPLVGMKVIKKALPMLSTLAEKHGLEYSTELVTNGEFLTGEVASFFHRYRWGRLQITLDGPRDVHDSIRFGANKRPTFNTIINNMMLVLDCGYIEKVDIRINYTSSTKNRIGELLEYLASLGVQHKLNLSFGIIMPTLSENVEVVQQESAESYLSFCKMAKELGFEIPVEYTVGPWCVATEKHSVVLQPDGGLQKCISTVGRHQYDFSDVSITPKGYAKDTRFERFKRIDACKKEKCPYLPICGGGCPWDSLVAYGKRGFGMRFCQKTLLDIINRGLLRLDFSG